MLTLVDGYNVLHAVGFRGNLSAPGKLERARVSLIGKLAKYLSQAERKQTIVIFDAGRRSQEKPQQYVLHKIRVEFAYGFENADSMIEMLIGKNPTPQKLLVVSSDHRIQRAAKRRKATFIDSDIWIDLLESGKRPNGERQADAKSPKSTRHASRSGKPKLRESAEYWMSLFDSEEIEQIMEESHQESASTSNNWKPNLDPDDVDLEDLDSYNPFPEGYGEDVE